ncbi:MAG: 30S ribosome-binding factor RbfA [Myxococcota bacterium]|nr:30S ribosome-binding factor RbfA [Myxococcota bacterium]
MSRRRSKNNQHQGPSSRPAKVGEVIRKIISGILTQGSIKEPRLSLALTTVTEVRVTPDLQHAIAYVSVFSDDAEVQEQVIQGLSSASKEIQRQVGRELTMRYTPQVRFELDGSIVEGAKIQRLLNEVSRETDADVSMEDEVHTESYDG